ncbi:MAG: ZIP family metal transporter [Clostridiales bacterium]|nr:ZIP family metal transporter [Clostridiales bacterium]
MNIIAMSTLAGVIGTGFGGLLTAIFGSRTDKMISIFLSFAGGVMSSIVFFELIPEAMLHSSIAVIILGLGIGVVMVLILNNILDKVSDENFDNDENTKLHATYKDFYHETDVIASQNSMMRSGVLMFFVIGLHNVPEGLAIGAAGNYNISLGFTLALMIGLHNIPEGMAISAPLISGGLSKGKSILLTVLAGVPTVLGALIGVLMGGISNFALALAFSTAGGAMLYAVFGEILPQSVVMSKNRIPTIVLLVGVVFGLAMTKLQS